MAAAPPADSTVERLPGTLVVDTLDTEQPPIAGEASTPLGMETPMAALNVAPSAAVATPAGGFTICHDGSVPPAVLADVDEALQQWTATLSLTGPTIAVDLAWRSFGGGGTLGIAGPTEFIVYPQLPVANTGYPIALANQLLGSDANGTGCGADNSEMMLHLNSSAGGDGSLWNIGLDDATSDQVDLSTVVLHEVAHGLGIVSSAQLVNDVVAWPRANAPLYIYDRFFAECANESEQGCDTESTPLTASSTATLRSTRLWFRNRGGRSLELHAPTTWSGGSSVSHLDEVRYPASSGLSLMTPYLRRGENFVAIDPALQSMTQTLGWTLTNRPVAPAQMAATAGNARIDVSFDRPELTAGAPATGYRVTVSAGPTVVRSVETTVGAVGIDGLDNGSVYHVAVSAVNSAGASAPTTPAANRLIPLELPPFATAETAVQQISRDLLGFDLTPTERSAAVVRLRGTGSLAAEAAAVAVDPRLERRMQVVRLYLGFFERDPDPLGLAYWFEQVAADVSLDVVASSFAIASEFERGQSVPDGVFIDAAYARILDRLPDQAGRDYWLSTLARGLDRGQMLILFSESAEHVAKTKVDAIVITVSFGMLGRLASGAERTSFDSLVMAGGAPRLAATLATSADYDARHRPR